MKKAYEVYSQFEAFESDKIQVVVADSIIAAAAIASKRMGDVCRITLIGRVIEDASNTDTGNK